MALLQIVVAGLAIGLLYALLAAGLNLVFGVFDLLNIAHGEFLFGGAIVSYLLWNGLGLNPLLTIPISAVVMFAVGAVIQSLLVERVLKHGLLTALLLLFGVAVLAQGLGLLTLGVGERSIRFLSGSVNVGGLFYVSNVRLLAIAVAVPVMLLMHFYLKYTRLGVATKATAQNADIAEACGINVRRIRILTMGISAALAGIAGSLLIMIFPLTPQSSLTFTIIAFVVAVVGGMGSYYGSIVAGIVYGVGEGLATFFVDARSAIAMGFLLLVVVLLIRPAGIAGLLPSSR